VKPFKLLHNFERLQQMRLVVAQLVDVQDPAHVDPHICVSGNTCRIMDFRASVR
jgi:hypothetical protein